MKIRAVVLMVVLALSASTVFAVGHIGPPTAQLTKGQWSGGFNYSYSVQDLDDTKVKWSWFDDGVLDESGVDKVKITDLTTNLYYGNLGYGISDTWQIYVQAGVADIETDAEAPDNGYFEDDKFNLDFDNDFAWGWGTKITFAKQDKIEWGTVFQMNWLDTSLSEKDSASDVDFTESWKDTIDVEAYDLLLAIGPTIDMGGWKLYGGPFYYYLSGDLDAKETGNGVDEGGPYTWNGKASGDLESDSSFGGYIGAQFVLAENWDMSVEVASTFDNGWGVGAGITFKF